MLTEVAGIVDAMLNDLRFQVELKHAWQELQVPVGGAALSAQTVQHLEREAERSRQRLTRAAELLVDGRLDRSGYERLRSKAEAELEAAEAELDRLGHSTPTTSLPPLERVLHDAGGWSRALREAEVAAQREVLLVLVQRIVPVRVRFGKYEMQIEWTALGEALRHIRYSQNSVAVA